MHVQVQRAAEALDQGHGAVLRSGLFQPRLPDQVRADRPVDDAQHGGDGRRFRGKQKAQRERHAQHPLAQGLPGQDLVHQQRRGLRHAPRPAARAEAAALAAEGRQAFRVALRAADPQETVLQPATPQLGVELLLHEGRQHATVPFQGRG